MRIIQFLNCDIKSITNNLDIIKKQNFDTIQINPVQPFINVDGNPWWTTYQPLSFKIGNTYGTKNDLKELCDKAKEKDINVVVDVITNHLANNGYCQETIPHKDIEESIRNNKSYWKNHKKVNEFKSYKDIIEESIGLPGLNLKNEDLQNIILNFLEELKDCGVKGFRFDAAKHIGLPSDGVSYFEKISEFLNKNNLFAYAEFLDGPHNVSNELTKTINEKKNEFSKLMYVLTEEESEVENKAKKVTFVESHDTYLNEWGSTKDISSEKIIDKYSELTEKYEHTLFYVRDLKKGQTIYNCNYDRTEYIDSTWMNSDKLRKANLNKGNEYRERKTENNINNKKEENKMEKSQKIMNLHHDISMKLHEIFITHLEGNKSINEHVDIILLDYNIQMILNSLMGITPYDDFLIKCIIGELYKNKWDKPPINNISYPEFSIKVLEALKTRILNYSNNDGLENAIKILKM